MSKIAVIDYGIGNVFSVCNALSHVGADVSLTRNISEIRDADRIVLPGVGAFGRAIAALNALGLDEVLSRYKETGRPFLGICIGMQLAMSKSFEFGDHQGLGYIPGAVERIPDRAEDGSPLSVPHIAWTKIQPPETNPDAWRNTPMESFEGGESTVYFVHSYHCATESDSNLLAVANYGGKTLTAAIHTDGFMGVQFHPERSGPTGLKFLERFMNC